MNITEGFFHQSFIKIRVTPKYCGGHYPVKSAAYVSAAREVSQPKFIAHFFCKALIAVHKNQKA